jgi:hypothetical protein
MGCRGHVDLEPARVEHTTQHDEAGTQRGSFLDVPLQEHPLPHSHVLDIGQHVHHLRPVSPDITSEQYNKGLKHVLTRMAAGAKK